MYGQKKSAICPVCDSKLGYLNKAEICSFLCDDCRFIFTWDREGKIKAPIKYEPYKPKSCSCEGCKWRDSHK